MKPKHFTFDLDYFPISGSNVFQSITIDQKNKNSTKNKNGVKRFALKNELNFQQIPEIMYFEKSMKKPKNQNVKENISPISNQTKKSHNCSYDDLEWSFDKNSKRSHEKERRVESCPKPSKFDQHKLIQSLSKSQLKMNSMVEDKRRRIQSQWGNFHKNSNKQSQQLESLEECQSEFDEISQDSMNRGNKIKLQNVKSEENDKQSKRTKCTNSQKHNKSKKTQKSHVSKGQSTNPEISSKKLKPYQKSIQSQNQKQTQTKATQSLLGDDNLTKRQNKKFISLNRNSYYLIGSKGNKNRSLNKEKKAKQNKSVKQQANVILTNGDVLDHSTSNQSNCRNSLTSTTNYKPFGNNREFNQDTQLRVKVKTDSKVKEELFAIVKRTNQVLDKYKDECVQLKKEKDEYQLKYEEAIKKLVKIRQELQTFGNSC